MAKSRLYNNAYSAVAGYARIYDSLMQELHDHQVINDGTVAQLRAQAGVVRTAFHEADQHFQTLERRTSSEKTVADRLRNLKNVFKSSKELMAAREIVKGNLNKCKEAFDTIERLTEWVIKEKASI